MAQEIVTESAMGFSKKEREQQYQKRWDEGGLTFIGAFGDLLLNEDSNQTAQEFVREKIRTIVKDEKTAEMLSPKSTLGCKRLCVDSDYFEAFNRSNVSLIDISANGISRVTKTGVQANGKEFEVDMIVLATGYDAITGALNKIDIVGSKVESLIQKWQHGPKTYLGMATADFPNLFFITGPGSPSVLSNVLTSIEYHVEWISECIEYMAQNSKQKIEVTKLAEEDWQKKLNKVVDATLYRTCNSWYLGANIPGKSRVFLPFPGVPPYEDRCKKIAANGYVGFDFA